MIKYHKMKPPGIGGYCLPKDGGLGVWSYNTLMGFEDYGGGSGLRCCRYCETGERRLETGK